MRITFKCENCINARRAENDEYVGCVALTSKDIDNEDYWYNFYERNEIATGWVDLRAKPNGKSSGMITNGIPCFKKNDICNHYECDPEIYQKVIY